MTRFRSFCIVAVDRAVEDADHAERDQERPEVRRRRREQVQPEAQQSVRAELEHDAGHHRPSRPSAPGCRRRAARCAAGTAAPSPRTPSRIPRNNHRSVDCASDWELAICTRSKVTCPPWCCALSTTSTIIATSMNAEPNIVYRKNFVAAYLRSAYAPTDDQEVHRHQHELEHHEEQEEVERDERPRHPNSSNSNHPMNAFGSWCAGAPSIADRHQQAGQRRPARARSRPRRGARRSPTASTTRPGR